MFPDVPNNVLLYKRLLLNNLTAVQLTGARTTRRRRGRRRSYGGSEHNFFGPEIGGELPIALLSDSKRDFEERPNKIKAAKCQTNGMVAGCLKCSCTSMGASSQILTHWQSSYRHLHLGQRRGREMIQNEVAAGNHSDFPKVLDGWTHLRNDWVCDSDPRARINKKVTKQSERF